MTKTGIAVADLRLPKNVAMNKTKTAVTFYRGTKKAVLKGRALEVTNPIKELEKRLRKYSQDVIENCHLGSIRGVVSGIENTVDLQKILTKYFK